MELYLNLKIFRLPIVSKLKWCSGKSGEEKFLLTRMAHYPVKDLAHQVIRHKTNYCILKYF